MNRLVWLLASLALAIAPHLAHLPVWVGPLCVGLGIWRVAVERGITPWPHKALVVALTLGCTAGILFEYRTLLGRDAGVTLLVTMIALKLMEMRTPRDTLVTVFLAYFLVSAGFLYSQSIPMALYLLGVVWLTTTTMIGYHDPNGGLAARNGGQARIGRQGIGAAQTRPAIAAVHELVGEAQAQRRVRA